jgi:hypothetical protein
LISDGIVTKQDNISCRGGRGASGRQEGQEREERQERQRRARCAFLSVFVPLQCLFGVLAAVSHQLLVLRMLSVAVMMPCGPRVDFHETEDHSFGNISCFVCARCKPRPAIGQVTCCADDCRRRPSVHVCSRLPAPHLLGRCTQGSSRGCRCTPPAANFLQITALPACTCLVSPV